MGRIQKRDGLSLSNITVPFNNTAYTLHSVERSLVETLWRGPGSDRISVYTWTFAAGGGVPKSAPGNGGANVTTSTVDAFTYGGATRQFIYGSARWGSGFGVLVEDSKAELPFANGYGYRWAPWTSLEMDELHYPFGFWPLSWGRGYSTSGKWRDDDWRPGNTQVVALLKSSDTSKVEWWAMGDSQSMEELLKVLSLPTEKGGCGISGNTPVYKFDPEENNVLHDVSTSSTAVRTNVSITPMTAVQYYRGSSFALGLLGHYDPSSEPNVAAASDGYWARALIDYPAALNRTGSVLENGNATAYQELAREQDSFLQCLNGTIAGTIPIYDSSIEPTGTTIFYMPTSMPRPEVYGPRPSSTSRDSGGIIAGTILAPFLLFLVGFCCWKVQAQKDREKQLRKTAASRRYEEARRVSASRQQQAPLVPQEDADEPLPVYTPKKETEPTPKDPPAQTTLHATNPWSTS
ncbi:SubName: Full=Uncharacterized protein {ECO:0000313/EMBL:CCA72724.1} [Serendipita indica DSM 11827]|uniref:Uncharacterized protein n=1 Tax=Serendipita indica (strain DSM 11827) TaxID=1109443 RepID=G4TN31_SERID|nr:SubName: Full=Uncharacterized protein {ECO:0000313/EMBL:CCA72724.1} [Serendipita indica DSM 11827]CCA72724.1 hypothetical protein PIIN_06661 [Serendipita indica DSM 11827]